MANDEVQVLVTEVEGKLTDEQILALKVIAYKKLTTKNYSRIT